MIAAIVRFGLAALLLGLTATAATSGQAACPAPPGSAAMAPETSPGFVAAFLSLQPERLSVGEVFAAEITICGGDASAVEKIQVEAIMPAHRHGMNYLPEITKIEPGRYRADGLLFHMPGKWRIDVAVFGGKVIGGGRPVRFSRTVILE